MSKFLVKESERYLLCVVKCYVAIGRQLLTGCICVILSGMVRGVININNLVETLLSGEMLSFQFVSNCLLKRHAKLVREFSIPLRLGIFTWSQIGDSSYVFVIRSYVSWCWSFFEEEKK